MLLAIGFVLSLGAAPAAAQTDPEKEVTVRVFDRKGTRETDDDVAVEGARITVTDTAGDEIDEVETDEEGRAVITLPGEGQYTATLDLDSLPEDIGLPREGGEVLQIDPNRSSVVIFVLGDRERAERGFSYEVAQTIWSGIQLGLIIAMASVGLSLIFGTTGLVNFAHGELVTFGAVVAWFLNNDHNVGFVFAALIAVVASGLFGGALDRFLWRPLRKKGLSLVAMMVVSIGLGFALRNFLQIWYGPGSEQFRQYGVGKTQTHEIFSAFVSTSALITMGLSLLILLLVGVLLQMTRMGKAVRAVADNPDLAASSGIDVDRVVSVVWIAGAALAGLGGVFLGLATEVKFDIGNQILLLLFAGIILGGLGTAYGALVGGFVLGMLVELSTLWISPNLKAVGALFVLILILLVRPQGILGRAERVG